MLKQAGCDEQDVAPIAEASRGNLGLAFHLLEQVRKRPGLRQELPQTLLALRLVRLRTLGDAAYEAARVAAALGDTFPQEVLYACADLPLEAVDALVREGVLKESHSERMPLLEFVDWRDRAALSGSTSVDGPRRRASVFCARMLDLLNPAAFEALNELILPLALPALPTPAASFWREAEAATRTNRAQAEAALSAAAVNAVGIRKLVLTRRVADLQLSAGQPDRALATLNMAGIPNTAPSPLPPDAVGEIISGQLRAPLDCWESLGGAEAQAAFALVKAEALAQLVKTEDTVRAFDDARRRLEALKSPLAGTLWVRWAKGWSWFASEILGHAKDAVKACDEIRKRVGAAVETDADALGFLRAEQVARTSSGDFSRGKELVEKQVRMAERRGLVRDLCLASNARAILHFGEGELLPARTLFARAVELARASGWVRREAISLHNLALVLSEHGELDAAHEAETEYARLSEKIGNHAGQAEAPLVLASVAIAKEKWDLAKQLITQARTASDLNGWSMLTAWSRALNGRSLLAQALTRKDPLELAKARNELAAALEALEDTNTAWTEELDPGEVYALSAVAQLKSGHGDQARQVLERGAAKVVTQNVVATRTLGLGQAAATGKILEALAWFEEREYVRLVTLWKKIAAALG
jgi:tetratricopeptide (TPR) repeat protein